MSKITPFPRPAIYRTINERETEQARKDVEVELLSLQNDMGICYPSLKRAMLSQELDVEITQETLVDLRNLIRYLRTH